MRVEVLFLADLRQFIGVGVAQIAGVGVAQIARVGVAQIAVRMRSSRMCVPAVARCVVVTAAPMRRMGGNMR
jgi:hypothetical protein